MLAILAGGAWAEAKPRRNRNICVSNASGSGFFIKQPDTSNPGTQHTVSAEGRFYARHAHSPERLCAMIPRLVCYDPAIPALILELLLEHQTLSDLSRAPDKLEFPLTAWARLGSAVGEIHRELGQRDMAWAPTPSSRPLWRRAHKPGLAELADLSPARLTVLEIIQGSTTIADGLESVNDLWRPDTVIHGDLRPDNVLVSYRYGAVDDIRIVDWELHQTGDAMWDLGACLQALVALWIEGLPLSTLDDVDAVFDGSGFPTAVFQAACRSLWEGYLNSSGTQRHSRDTLRCKAAHFAAIRMIQSALEMTTYRAELPELAVIVLQVCENVLADPARASNEFFALN